MKAAKNSPRFLPWLAFVFFLVPHYMVKAQTTLSAGDIAFTGYNSDGNDSFSIILLKDIEPNTEIRFTDNGWNGSALLTGETEIVYTNTTGNTIYTRTELTLCGTSIVFSKTSISAGTISGSALSLDDNGDQIFIYQGSSSSPSFIAGIHTNAELAGIFPLQSITTNSTDWDGSSSTPNKSKLSGTGLTAGTSAVFLYDPSLLNITHPEEDNWRFDCTDISGSISDLRSACFTRSNWNHSNLSVFDPCSPNCTITSTTWNGTSWSHGSPTSSIDATVYSDISTDFSCSDLTIGTGANISVPSGKSITVNGDLINNGIGIYGGGDLIFTGSGSFSISGDSLYLSCLVYLESGTTLSTNGLLVLNDEASLMHGTSAPGGGGSISGNVTIRKRIESSSNEWRQFSLPVSSTVDDFESGLNTLVSNHSNSSEINVYYWDATVRSGSSNNVANGWTTASSSDDESKAYIIYMASNGAHNFEDTVSISGTVFEGDKVVDLEYTFDPGGDSSSAIQRGWNFIPNPYPSNIDITTLLQDGNFGPTYKAVHVWDAGSGQYKAINISGLTNYNTNGGSVFTEIAYIPPFQGFWVKADASSQQITLNNASRIASSDSLDNFFKSEPLCAVFKVSDKSGRQDDVKLCQLFGSGIGFDGQYDLLKLHSINLSMPNLFIMEKDNNYISFNSVPIKNEYQYKLGFQSFISEEYSIEISEFHFEGDWKIEITDLKKNKVTELNKHPYTFHYPGDYRRKEMLLTLKRRDPVSIGKYPVEKNNNSWTYCKDSRVHLVVDESRVDSIKSIRLIELNGHCIDASPRKTGNTFIFDQHPIGYYIITVIDNDGNTEFLKGINR